MKINDTRRALKDMLAVKVSRLTRFANDCHDEVGRFCGEGGAQGDTEAASAAPSWLSAEQRKIHDGLPVSKQQDYIHQLQQANRAAGKSGGKSAAPSPAKAPAPSGSGNVRTYNGPPPAIVPPHVVGQLSDKDIEAIEHPTTAQGKARPGSTEYAGLAAFVEGQNGEQSGWVPPFPHPAYKSAVAGISGPLYAKGSDGRTGLEKLLAGKTVEYYDPGQKGKGNPTYVYDGKAIGIPFNIGVSIDQNKSTNGGVPAKITSVFPRNITLADARDRLASAGVKTGIEIVNINTSEGLKRMAQLNGGKG